jgi:hypothetical protein
MNRQKRSIPRNYYVYLIAANGVPRYVGSGQKYRVFDHFKQSSQSLVGAFLHSDLSYEILKDGIAFKGDALKIEREFIDSYQTIEQGGTLLNERCPISNKRLN